jgi:hypothetical protein
VVPRAAVVLAVVVAAAACTSGGAGSAGGDSPAGASAGASAGTTIVGPLTRPGTFVAADDAGHPLPPGVTLTAWQPLFTGIRLRRGHATDAFGLPGTTRPQDLTVLDIDLATPGLRFETNPAGGVDQPPRPGHQVHTAGGTLHDLVAAHSEIKVAINANFFWPCCYPGGADATANGGAGGPVGMTLLGLAVDDGHVVSDPSQSQQPAGAGCAESPAVPRGAVGATALEIDRSNRASITDAAAGDPIPQDLQVAVAGGPQPDPPDPGSCQADDYPPQRPIAGPARLLQDGRTETTPSAEPPEIVAGRTFVGLAEHGTHLLLATVDGSDLEGAAFADEAAWLQLLGATDGLNLDGGGSTTMVADVAGLTAPPPTPCPAGHPADAPGHDAVVELNVPAGYQLPGERGVPLCRERLIGTYLGVVVP